VILSGQQADKFYFFIYLAHRRAELNCFDIRAPLPKKAGGAGAAETMRALTSSRVVQYEMIVIVIIYFITEYNNTIFVSSRNRSRFCRIVMI
jgi:hypothetical protein